MEDRPQPAAGDVIAERYRVEGVLGAGAAGVVLDAVHVLTGRAVALKWLHAHLAHDDVIVERFLREARAAVAVDHPNVVSVLDAGRDGGTMFLVTEKLEGEPLRTRFNRGAMSPSELVDALMPAMRGVAAAHAHGIVHRDLKPDNVFLVRARPGWPGGAKVLDFGISKLFDVVQGGRELTVQGSMLGSPYYMAPEQISDSKAINGRADIYALGVMLYEGLTGQPPFDAETIHELIAKILRTDPFPIPRADVPPELEEIVKRAMARDRDLRFSDVRELALALEPFGTLRFDEDGARVERASAAPLEIPSTFIGGAPPPDLDTLATQTSISPAGTDPARDTLAPDPPGRVSLIDFPDLPTVPPRTRAAPSGATPILGTPLPQSVIETGRHRPLQAPATPPGRAALPIPLLFVAALALIALGALLGWAIAR